MDNIPAPPKGKNTINCIDKHAIKLIEHLFFYYRSFFDIFSLRIFFLLNVDNGLRNIIDKLAEFVARNGPEFETITKAKQQSNPRFSFLFGGEFYQYYQWRVSAEQAGE